MSGDPLAKSGNDAGPAGDLRAAETPEERIRAFTVGEVETLSAPIVLVEYDPAWPARYAHEAANIRDALGSRALQIEHVGSTSVPGLAAKPIIDIVLVVRDSSHESEYVQAMERAGYALRIREPEWYEHRLLRSAGGDVNVHVFTVGCPEIERMLVFRDWLVAHADDRELYANAKRALARRAFRFVQHYADAKTSVVQQILERSLGAK